MNVIPPEFPSTSSAFPSAPMSGPYATTLNGASLQQNHSAPHFMHNPPMYGVHGGYPMHPNGPPIPQQYHEQYMQHMMAMQQNQTSKPSGKRNPNRSAAGQMPMSSPPVASPMDPSNGMPAPNQMNQYNGGRPFNGSMQSPNFPMMNGINQMDGNVVHRQMQSMNGAGMSPANMICQPPPYPYPQQQQQFWPHGMNGVPPDMPSTSSAYPPNGAPSTPTHGPINSGAPQSSANGPQMFMGSLQMHGAQGMDGSIYPNGFHQQGGPQNNNGQQLNGTNERSASRSGAVPMSISSPSITSSVDPTNGGMHPSHLSPYSGGSPALTPLKNGAVPQSPFNQIYPTNGNGPQQPRGFPFPPGVPNKAAEAEWVNGSPGHLTSPLVGDMAFMNHAAAEMPNGAYQANVQYPQPSSTPKNAPRSRKRKASAQAVNPSPGPTPSPHVARPDSMQNPADYGQTMPSKPDSTAQNCSVADAFPAPSAPAQSNHSANHGNADEDNPLKKIERMTDLALKEPSSAKTSRSSDANKERESNLEKQRKIDYIESMTRTLTEQPQQQPQMVPYGAMARMPSQVRLMHPGPHFPPGMPPYASQKLMESMRQAGCMPPHGYPMPMGPNGQPMPFRGPFPPQMAMHPMNGAPMSPTLPQLPSAAMMHAMAARSMGMPPTSSMMGMTGVPAQMMPRMMQPNCMPPGMGPPMMMPPGARMMMPNDSGMMHAVDGIPTWQHVHPMPQSLTNLDNRVPNNKMQYLPDGRTVVANCAPTAAS